MPEISYTKIKHFLSENSCRKSSSKTQYAELQVTSNFSFLQGASHPEELVTQADSLGYKALAITDLHSLAGVVRAYSAAKEKAVQFIVGSKLVLIGEEDRKITLLVYPTDRESYARLCLLLTIGKRRAPKGECLLTFADFLGHQKGLAVIIVDPVRTESPEILILKDLVGQSELLSIALTTSYEQHKKLFEETFLVAKRLNISTVATNDVYYHIPARKPLQDVLTCIRDKFTIEQAGFALFKNAERYLKPPDEMARIFRQFPEAIRRTVEVAEICSGFSLEQLRYEYPNEICPDNLSPLQYLTKLSWAGAKERYPGGVPEKIQDLIRQELVLIQALGYEKYFLTCYDIVKFANSRGILCQGRGAAANSAICYCLGITAVNPDKIDLLFARFVSKERNEPPDIDIDFEHERREEVIQYIYQRYGRHRAGLTAEVVTYRYRSAIRDVGKALGLPLETVDQLAKSIHRWTDCKIRSDALIELGLDPSDTTIRNALILSSEILGFPRHLGQHVGGFIISERALSETVPILNAAMPDRTIIEWDKDDIEILGMLKIDVLGLGMLSCIKRALQYINRRRIRENRSTVTFYSIPEDDPKVYEMISAADTIGVFQIESRAQMSMLPRLKPQCFYDLVIEVAIVRPGPIQGNMVHPYLRRRNGLEKVNYPDKRVEDILGKTLGVPLFQEQAMRLSIVLANFTPGEAEKLRRAMAAWKKNKEAIAQFKEKIVKGMTENGYSEAFAENCMNQIKGFSEYGFPESHAASFANLVYASSWIKKYYPAEFAAALINSQPMGFYAPAQLITDAKEHGVEIRAIDINKSGWDCSLEKAAEDSYALRLGMRLVRGLAKEQAALISDAVTSYGQFNSISALWHKTHTQSKRLRKATLQALARADAFGSLALSQREALWEIRGLPPEPAPIDALEERNTKTQTSLPLISKQEAMFLDYESTGLSLRAHPIGLIRARLNTLMVSPAAALKKKHNKPQNLFVSVAGIAICRQRPGTAKGVTFITLEDETGITNLIVRPDIFEKYGKVIISSSTILAHGKLDRIGDVIYITAQKLESLDPLILGLKENPFPSRSYSY